MSPDLFIAITARMLQPGREPFSLELSHGVNFDEAVTIGRHVSHHVIVKQRSHLLKRKACCLRKELPYETERDDVTADEDQVVPLSDVPECCGTGSRIQDCGHEVSEQRNGKALGSDRGGEDFCTYLGKVEVSCAPEADNEGGA